MVFSRHSAASLKGLKMLSLTALRNLLPSLIAASTCGVMLPISSNSTTSNSAYPQLQQPPLLQQQQKVQLQHV